MELNWRTNKPTMFCFRIYISLVVLFCILQTAQSQFTADISTNPVSPYTGITVQVICDFNLAAATTLKNVTFMRDVTPMDGTFATLFSYDVDSATPTDSGEYTSGSISGSYNAPGSTYTISMTAVAAADAGNYSCEGWDSAGDTVSTTPHIQIDVPAAPCSADPCVNGNCTDVDSSRYTCTCEEGWEGTTCNSTVNGTDINCSPSPCQGLGICQQDQVNGYKCFCDPCHDGTNCENEISNPCVDNPCPNGAKCTSQCPSRTCACAVNWKGASCDQVCDNIKSTTSDLKVLLGSSVSLMCERYLTSHSVYWSSDASGSPKLASTSEYNIPEIGAEPSYYCFVTGGGCTQRIAVPVDVYWSLSPNVTEQKNETWYVGEKKTLECEVISNPEAMVQWLFTPGADKVEASGNTTVITPAQTMSLTNVTANMSTAVIEKVDSSHSGLYVCTATLNPTFVIKEFYISVEKDKKKGLPWWAILLIVLGVLIIIGVIVFLIVYFCCIKKGKKVFPSRGRDKMHEVSDDNNRSEDNGNYKSEKEAKRTGAYGYDNSKKKMYDEEAETEEQPPRPLPHMPEGGRGLALQPLNIEAERKRIRRKKKKKNTAATDDEEEPEDDRKRVRGYSANEDKRTEEEEEGYDRYGTY